jgi:hypothetical protein
MEQNECSNVIHDDLEAISSRLRKTSHFFWLQDARTGAVVEFDNLSDDDACRVIELITKRHGGEVIDRVIDKIIQDDERLEFPEILSE